MIVPDPGDSGFQPDVNQSLQEGGKGGSGTETQRLRGILAHGASGVVVALSSRARACD